MLRIRLPQGLFALIDDEDANVVRKYKWTLHKGKNTNYVRACGPRKIYMHRLIMAAPKHSEVDHKNRNGLDNQRSNLRLCTRQQNCCNKKLKSAKTSLYRGVSFKSGKWRVQITVNQQVMHIGLFQDEMEAARAYDARVQKCFGEFATLNFP